MTTVNVTPFEIQFRTRDGLLLRADVYLPPGGQGAFPTLLAASPYQKSLRRLPAMGVFPFIEYGPIQLYLDHGYAYVILDLPGSGVSEGIWDPWSKAEGEATHDAIEYIATQPWSSGRIGMIGQSYYAMSQWNAARTRPPHLTTIVPYDGSCDPYRDFLYHGGVPIQGFLGSWLIGSVLLQHTAEGHDVRGGARHEVLPDVLSHTLDDGWHRRRAAFWELGNIDIPVFSIGVWGKASLHLRGNVNGFAGVRGPRRLLITEPDTFHKAQHYFAEEALHREELLPWYDHHLKGVDNGVMDQAAVRYFVNGRGRYASTDAWPPADAVPCAFYLSGARSGVVNSLNDGSLTDAAPAEAAASTAWTYPDEQWVAGVTTFVNGVPDHVARVNTFTTAPFEKENEFTGQGALVLHASSDQADFDVFVKLSLLPAPGRPGPARKMSQGWLRASHRREDPALTQELRPFHTHDRAEPVAPGQVVELRIELMPMGFVVQPGERLRLEITNNDSTMIDQPMTHWYGQKVGTDTYHHDRLHPSRLLLPQRAASSP